jgi:lysophospholipase L1-like esterase
MKNFLKNSLLVIFSLALALALGEFVVRVYFPEETRKDDKLGFIGNPGGQIDHKGFRNSIGLSQADIVAIGDSQTYGNNAETPAEAWPQVLGGLQDKSVYQMAFGGYGPIQYRALFETAVAMQPERIIVGLYLGNDLHDAYSMACRNENWQDYCTADFVPEEGSQAARDAKLSTQYGLSPDSWRLKIIKIRLAIREKSRLYAFFGDATRGLREKIGLAEKKDDISKRINDFAASSPDSLLYEYGEGLTTVMSDAYRLAALDPEDKRTKVGLEIIKRTFAEMKALAQEKGVAFTVVVIPTKEMVYYEYAKTSGRHDLARLDNITSKEKELSENIFSFFKEQDIAFRYVLPDLAQAISEGKAIYPKVLDGHPTALGYTVIAKSLDKFLVQSLAEGEKEDSDKTDEEALEVLASPSDSASSSLTTSIERAIIKE